MDHYLDDHHGLLLGIDKLAGRVSPIFKLIRETADKYRVMQEPMIGDSQPLVDAPAYSPASLPSVWPISAGALTRSRPTVSVSVRSTILVVPPSNGAEFDPNRSFLPAETPRAQRSSLRSEHSWPRATPRMRTPTGPSSSIDRSWRGNPASLRRTIGWAVCSNVPAPGIKLMSTIFWPATWTGSRCGV